MGLNGFTWVYFGNLQLESLADRLLKYPGNKVQKACDTCSAKIKLVHQYSEKEHVLYLEFDCKNTWYEHEAGTCSHYAKLAQANPENDTKAGEKEVLWLKRAVNPRHHKAESKGLVGICRAARSTRLYNLSVRNILVFISAPSGYKLTVLTLLVVEGLERQSFSYPVALFLVAGPVFFLSAVLLLV
eukprot:1153031-Pelagomonas_calceolata.AAC.4